MKIELIVGTSIKLTCFRYLKVVKIINAIRKDSYYI